MHELVARLDRRGSSWLPLAAGVSVAAVTSVGITLAVRGSPPPGAPDCEASGSLSGTWDDAARARLAATLAPLAVTGERVRDALDAYALRWSAARIDACEDTFVRRTQSDEAMDLRMSCLDERRRDLTALLAATDKGAPTPKLVDAAFALPPIERCARLDLLRLVGEPQSTEGRRRGQELRDRLREAKVAYDLARYGDGVPIVDKAVAEATVLGADALRAEAMYWQGRFQGQLGDSAASETTLRAAARTGEAARADEIVAHARTALVFVIALQQKDFGRLDAWVADAQAAIARIGGDAGLTARLHLNRGAVLETGSGRSKEALEEFRAAEAGYRALGGGDSPDVARSLTNAGTSLWTLRRLDEAEATMKRALAIYESAFGDRHPQIGQTLLNLSGVARGRGDRPAAVAYAQRAVDLLTASLGAAHPTTATALGNLGHTLFFAGRYDEALAIYERSQATLRANKANPGQIAQGNLVIANIHAQRGNLADAEKVLDEAQELYDRTFGPDSPDAQISRLSRAEIRIGKNALAGVAAELDKVAAVLAKTPDARFAPYVTRDRGLLAAAEGRHADAVVLLESVADASFLDATDAAEGHFSLAKELVASNGDRERALIFARRARAAYAAAEGEQGKNVASLDAFIAGLRK
jgi:tetratricopeptide (TPR) repeat protein